MIRRTRSCLNSGVISTTTPCDTEAFEELHHQNARGGDLTINLRDDDEVTAAIVVAETFDIVRLVVEVHLFEDHSREFFDHRAGCPNRVVIDELLDDKKKVLNDADVRGDQLFDAGTKNLDDHVFAAIPGTMHLSERSRSQRFFLKVLEHTFERAFQFIVDASSKLAGGKGRNTIVQLGEFFQVDGRNDVGPNAQRLCQFDEARSERSDALCQFASPLTVGFVGQEPRRPRQDPSAAVPQEPQQKRHKPKPYDEDSEDHECTGEWGSWPRMTRTGASIRFFERPFASFAARIPFSYSFNSRMVSSRI